MKRATLILAIFLVAPSLQAQSKTELREFELQLKLATTAFDSGRFEDAIKSFTRASEIVDHPRLRIQIALAHLKLSQCAAARGILEAVESQDLDPGTMSELEARQKDLEQCVGTGELQVVCDSGVEVLVNGAAQVCGTTTSVNVGEYQVSAQAPGFLTFENLALVEEGRLTEVVVSLEPEPQVVAVEVADPMPWDVIGLAAAGVGVGLIGVGIIDDMTTTSARLDDMKAAVAAGNQSRFEELESEGDAFAVRPVLLVSVGGALVVGGLATWWLSRTDESSLAIRIKTDGVEAAITW